MSELGQFASDVASWRQLMASMPDDPARWSMFNNAAQEIAGYVSKGLERVVAVDELQDIAIAHGLADIDQVQQIISDAFRDIEQAPYWEEPQAKEQPKPKANGKHDVKQKPLRVLSKAQFLAQINQPDYLIDGLLQRHFIYALTGQTGHAKTAVALLIAQLVGSVDRNAMLGTRRVRKGRVIYLVGENPDDVGYRIIASDAKRGGNDHPDKDNISFIPGIFDIGGMMGALNADCRKNGEAALIIVDTSAAYFLGNEELSNTQMGTYARTLRVLTTLPGGPTVLVLCHPIKHVTEPSQLLPRGGGAYLAEMDGNLTLWRLTDDMVELHHTKIRGPAFQAVAFQLESISCAKLTDKSGRPFSTVRAVVITQHEEERRLGKDEEDEDHLLAQMLAKPTDAGGSFATWAEELGWVDGNSEPYKKKVERIVGRLAAQKPKLVVKIRNSWTLTEEGKTAARKAALRFAAIAQSTAQTQMPFEAPPTEGASVAFMITNAMKADLRKRGFDEEHIRQMTPQEAHDILNQ